MEVSKGTAESYYISCYSRVFTWLPSGHQSETTTLRQPPNEILSLRSLAINYTCSMMSKNNYEIVRNFSVTCTVANDLR